MQRGACVNDDGAAPAGAALFRLRALSECINLAIHNLRRIPMRLLPLLAMLPLIVCSGQSDATDAASTASAGGDPVAAQGSGTSRSYDVTGFDQVDLRSEEHTSELQSLMR